MCTRQQILMRSQPKHLGSTEIKLHTCCERLPRTWWSMQKDNLTFAFSVNEVRFEHFRAVSVGLGDCLNQLLVPGPHNEFVDCGLSHARLLQSCDI